MPRLGVKHRETEGCPKGFKYWQVALFLEQTAEFAIIAKEFEEQFS